MRAIHLDQAATSSPKAPGVAEAVGDFLRGEIGSPGRGSYAPAIASELALLTLRQRLCDLLEMPDPACCFLTPGATWALNQALKGALRPGDHVLVSGVEHNAVMRPLSQLAGVTVERVPCAPDGTLDPAEVKRRFHPHTRMACMTHASNVCGTLLPLEEIGILCEERGVPLVVDAAQTAGHTRVSGRALHASAIAVPAHKGLLGPQGVGALLTTRDFAQRLTPLVSGGTSSRSESEEPPELLPDKLEPGTPNLPGAMGWLAALTYVAPRVTEIERREGELCALLLDGLRDLPGLHTVGLPGANGRTAVVSVVFERVDQAVATDRLAQAGVYARCGLHCAPSAHRTLGTYPQGTVRFSLGWRTTREDVMMALNAIQRAAKA